jgi:hypothetical protein
MKFDDRINVKDLYHKYFYTDRLIHCKAYNEATENIKTFRELLFDNPGLSLLINSIYGYRERYNINPNRLILRSTMMNTITQKFSIYDKESNYTAILYNDNSINFFDGELYRITTEIHDGKYFANYIYYKDEIIVTVLAEKSSNTVREILIQENDSQRFESKTERCIKFTDRFKCHYFRDDTTMYFYKNHNLVKVRYNNTDNNTRLQIETPDNISKKIAYYIVDKYYETDDSPPKNIFKYYDGNNNILFREIVSENSSRIDYYNGGKLYKRCYFDITTDGYKLNRTLKPVTKLEEI